ncbi:hypothetical protein UFOVP964_35 [uncultured Caudovirales phage]|uniref:Uncharacterized protein n=1 Tax=uncultured Caudovirales phage TaxID=2100421 RepID=A0A6J5QAP3_9CAUD|nr:hypothetical protein UFOVP854_35 [uncultured Caudovirales phage]CAB4174237.1 hypothetical protein UFOVP964_35 [uncultured Caudovirales phage]CAB4179487.1 hypothetical protein UFOVP1034_123 [uncultured Caudovirales phage]CAB4189167.1 hypothetical protein UFOVP1177_123 [uncultured Caudovirales phage]CAB4193592.1 hypothetical protein UFOVP1243_110 [uncultured Caudovirales phage]
MTAYYPAAVKNDYSTKIDFSDTILAIHVNSLQEEMTAVQTNLGTYIRVSSGWVGAFDKVTTTWDSLKDRLANIEYGLNSIWTAVPVGGTSGQVLSKSSGSDYATAWTTPVTGLPSQTGNNGKYLTTDGSSATWATVAQGGETISSFLLAGC